MRFKIILFALIVFCVGVFLFFWWRFLRTNSEQGGAGNASATSSSSAFQFSDVPRASDDLFSSGAGSSGDFDGYNDFYEEYGGSGLSSDGASSPMLTLSLLSDLPAFFQWAIRDTGEVFYMTSAGKVFIAEEGDDIEISSQELPTPLRKALLSSDGRLVLGLFGTRENPRWGMYDTIDTVWRPLPADITDAVWGANRETILVRKKEEDFFRLGTINTGDSALPFTSLIQDFRIQNVSLHMITPEKVLVLENPAPGIPSRMWELNPKTLAFKTLSAIEDGVLLGVSPNRDFILKYASPDYFRILNQNLEEEVPIFFVTLPQKCGFDQDIIFCFRPSDDYSDVPLFFDDYFKKRVLTTDSLVIFGPNSLGEDTLFISGGVDEPPIDGIYPMFSKGAYTFINRYDGRVYRLAR